MQQSNDYFYELSYTFFFKKKLSSLLLKTLRIISSLVFPLHNETCISLYLNPNWKSGLFLLYQPKDQSRSQYLGKTTENHEGWYFSGIKQIKVFPWAILFQLDIQVTSSLHCSMYSRVSLLKY